MSPQNKTTTYHYDAVGNRDSVVSPNGTSSGYQYDNLNRLTRVRHYKAGAILAHYAYTLNAAGIRTQVTEKDSSKVFYGYDSLYRLKSDRRTGNHTDTMTYTYDPVGNRLTKVHRGATTTYAYNSRNQLLSEWDGTDSTRYSYDSAGRMLTKAEVGGTTHYRWRDEDRLDSLYGSGVNVKYQYDADGRRVKDSAGSAVRQYLIDPLLPYGQVIAETDGSNSLVAEYNYGTDRVSLRRSGAAHYYLSDGQGSTRLLTDSTGTATDSTVYTAFGETLFSSGSTPNAYLYTGEQFDGSAGLYNLRARLMDPRMGRFASVDPFDGDDLQPATLHRYGYVGNSPISFSDPTGLLQYTIGGQATATSGLGILSSMARISFKLFMSNRVLLPLLAAGLTFNSDVSKEAQTQSILNSPAALEELRKRKKELEVKVNNASGGKPMLFAYGDRARVQSIYSLGEISASAGYPKGGRPPGAYATSIPPWYPKDDFTQRNLSMVFYNNPNGDVTHFVAFEKQPHFRSSGAIYEYVAPAPQGTAVPVNPFYFGQNLLLW